MVAQVVVDIAHTALKDTYDYVIPEGLELETGSRVLVPFGPSRVTGVVFGISDESSVPDSKLRAILEVLDPFPVMRDDDRELACYLAQTYHIPLARAVQKILPSRVRSGKPIGRKNTTLELAVTGEQLRAAFASLTKQDGSVKYPKQHEILKRLTDAGNRIDASGLSRSAVSALVRKGYVRVSQTYEMQCCATADVAPEAECTVKLADQQVNALSTIISSGQREFLLHGVTGSGKTEVYIGLVREVLKEGRSAIILVPEIALTPQIHDYLKSRLKVPVALFHSRMTEAERFSQWCSVRSGAARVVLGPRSAVLAPVDNLGAVIIDEEHETSYKASEYPPFTAREIAHFRAERSNAFLVLGSATPSIETYQTALDGKMKLVSMPDRHFGNSLPHVEIVDMRQEIRNGNPGIISESLDREIRAALGNGTQTMILLNRRGYSSFLICTSCGSTLDCSQCDVSLTFHKSEGMLKCHYCGERRPVPDRCPHCGGAHLRRVGIGTQKLEEYLHQQYPAARVLRMDADTMQGRTSHQEAYERFRSGGADILIGTQMIAKGFDFERVSVAAVLAADGLLHHPDFRSSERTFQQLAQLAGRAGRRGCGGKVFIQTYSPEHYAIQHAAQHDYEGFFRKESAYRKSLYLPPYGQYILVRFASADGAVAQHAARDFLGRLSVALQPYKESIIKARASPSVVKRIANEYRYQVMIHLRKESHIIEEEVYGLLSTVEYDGVLVGIDTSPVDMQ